MEKIYEKSMEKSVENSLGKSVGKKRQKNLLEKYLIISNESSEIDMNLIVIQKESLPLSLSIDKNIKI